MEEAVFLVFLLEKDKCEKALKIVLVFSKFGKCSVTQKAVGYDRVFENSVVNGLMSLLLGHRVCTEPSSTVMGRRLNASRWPRSSGKEEKIQSVNTLCGMKSTDV